MFVKKQAYDRVVQKLEGELSSINTKIIQNRDEFKRLANTQAVLKRECGILVEMIRDLKGKGGEKDGS